MQNVNTILVSTYDAIGDMVVTTPFFRELKKNFPNVQVDVLADNRNYLLLKYNPHVRNIYHHKSRERLPAEEDIELFKKLKANEYDLLINLWTRQSYLTVYKAIAIKAKKNITVEKLKRKKFLLHLFERIIGTFDYIEPKENTKNLHFTDKFLKMLEVIGGKVTNKNYEIFLPEEYRKKATAELKKLNKNNLKIIGLSFTGTGTRNTLSKKTVIDILYQASHKIKDAIFIIFGTPNMKEYIEEIIREVNYERVFIAPKTENILYLSAVIEQLDLLITTGTSTMNIASAMNRKMVIIHAPKSEFEGFSPIMNAEYRVIFTKKREITNCKIDTDNIIKNILEIY
jgi:ADP-heptose:LPS heptosyltransferase